MDTEGYTAFIRYILDKEDYRPIAWHRAYESLRSHPTQLSCLTTNTPEHQKFIHGFDEYAGRLCRFLNRIPQFLGRDSKAFEKMKNIGDIITEHLISVLISPSFSHLRNRESLFDLTVSTLEIAHPEHLGRIAALLCDRPAFLGKIISCERSSHFLLPWIRVLCIQHPNAVTLKSWTEVVASSCMACIGNHGLQTTLEEWEEIRAAALLHTNIQVTASILTKLCSSMPCRLCFTRFSDSPSQASFVPTATYPATHLSAGQQSASVIGTDVLDRQDPLIGDDLGLWKILLSGQALKDLETSKSKGNFESVWAKLEDLSTGDWVRKSVARPFPNPLKFKVRLFFASYGSNGRILWQVDSAYNPRYHAQSQVVRVWRIGDWKEISDAAETVAKTQRHWNAARVARCKVNKVDKVNGIKVPEFFPSIDDDLPHPVPQSNPPEEKEINLNLLITSKFHTLTTCIFDNIFRYQNEDAVFPFDLSSTEVAIIKHSETAAFILGRSGTGKTTCLLYKLLSRYLASRVDEDKDYVRQVLVTRSKTLAEKLHTELHALIRAQLINEVENQNPSIEDEPDRWDGTSEETTKSLFTLKRNGFPLVCTFTYFLKLVENTIRENDRQNFAIADRSSIGDFVDFQFFKAVYWPKFRYTRAIGRHLEANLVFSEIMGVIKGAASMQNGLKPLSRDEYITRSSSLAPAFPTTAEREVLFDLYSQYESSKRQHGHHDAMDRMISILHSITSNGLTKTLRNIVQEIYVDEVQDQRPLELELFLHIIQDPRGIHFAGDSAQCISNDSAFRFNNIKALFFEHYSKADPQLAKPMLFKLSRNYRSHQGILSFASFVMNLLWKGFPTMVDKLSPEIGQVTGPKPIFFVGAKVTELLVQVSTLTYIGNNQPQEATSISSNKQVVIVRDDGTRSHLKSLLGSNRIVYTILESKGMEYDDVFLYNFFQSSPCSAEMRTLEQLLPEGVNHSYAANNMIICSELRNLYVAVTRPRNRLWILESSTPSMLDLLSKLQEPLVDVQNIDHCNLPRLADTLRPITCTTTEDWNRTGRQCMDNELFDRALQCFENAGDERNIKWANACIFEQTGRELRANWELHSFRRSFKEAAKLFRELEMLEKAAGCLEALGEYVEAANLWSTKKHHERAAGLFEKAGVLYVEKAAEEYYAAGLPSRALSALYKAKHYESVIEGLTRHMGGDSIDNAERKSYATGCNLHARQPDTTIGSHLLEKAFNLFKTPEEKKEFLESFGFYEELLQFCISRGEYQDGIARLVLAGRLEDVLEFSLQRDAAWSWLPSSDEFLSEIYRSIKAEKLMEALDASKVLPESVISTGGKFATVPWVKQWDKQLSICHDILLTQRIPNKQELPNQGTIDLMSLLLLIKPEYFLKSTAGLSQFTCMLEYLEDYMQYLKPVTGQFPMFPDSTISCLGLLNLPWSLERTYYCASWSVLRKVKALQPASKEFGPRVLIEAHHYLAALVPKTVDKILSRANGSPTLMILNPCSKCVSQACWAPPHRPFTCRNHQLMSSWGFLEQFKERVRWWQVRCELRKTCSSYKLLPSDSILAKGSDLNDQLRFFFSYQSAFSQDAAVIGQACSRILKEGHYRLLLDRLKVLSINLVREEITRLEEVPEKNGAVRWNEGNLSTLMNGCRLMRMFGSDAFVEEPVLDIEHSVAYTLRPFRYYHKLKSLKDRGLHFQFTDIMWTIRKLQKALDEFIESKRCSSYNVEIIAMYEDVATLLLFLGWPVQVITPNSWGEQYLSYWAATLGPTLPLERNAYRYSLYRLTCSFCKLIMRLEDQVNKGLSQAVQELLTRRSVDFLVIILINFGNLCPRPNYYWTLYREIQIVLQIPALRTSNIRFKPPRKLLTAILHAFKFYNGKDHLSLQICEVGPIGRAFGERNRKLSRPGIYIHQRPTCKDKHRGCRYQARAKEVWGQRYPEIRKQAAAFHLYIAMKSWKERKLRLAKQNAALILYQRYQKIKERRAQLKEAARVLCQRYQKVKERRKAAALIIYQRYQKVKEVNAYRKSLEGAAISSIQTLFQKKRLLVPLKKYLLLLSIMMTDGVPLYLELQAVYEEFLHLDEKATQHGLKQKYGEHLDGLYDEINYPWDTLFQAKNFAVFDLDEAKLRQRLAEGMTMVTSVRQGLQDLSSEMFPPSMIS